MNEDKATRYHRLKRQASVVGLLWGVLLLAGLLATGASAALRDAAETAVGALPPSWQPGVTVLVYVVLLSLLNEAGSLPLAFYSGFLLERRYGLSNEPFGAWLRDQIEVVRPSACCSAERRPALVYWLHPPVARPLVAAGRRSCSRC